jgi:hypothetical protein
VFAFHTALLAGPACTSTHRAEEGNPDERVVDHTQDDQLDAGVAQAGRGAPTLDAGRFDNNQMPEAPRQQTVVEEEEDDGGLVPIYGGPFPDPKSRAKV